LFTVEVEQLGGVSVSHVPYWPAEFFGRSGCVDQEEKIKWGGEEEWRRV
jgi:hypothetical protein